MSKDTAAQPLVADADLKRAMRAHITAVLMARVSQDDARRVEALRDYLAVTQAAPDVNAAETIAMMVPPLMPSLYRRWIGMFCDRLLETAPQSQLEVLCDGSEENGGALALAFVMFLESERMEKQTADDLRAFGSVKTDDARESQMADVAANYLRARVADIARQQADKDAGKVCVKTKDGKAAGKKPTGDKGPSGRA